MNRVKASFIFTSKERRLVPNYISCQALEVRIISLQTDVYLYNYERSKLRQIVGT